MIGVLLWIVAFFSTALCMEIQNAIVAAHYETFSFFDLNTPDVLIAFKQQLMGNYFQNSPLIFGPHVLLKLESIFTDILGVGGDNATHPTAKQTAQITHNIIDSIHAAAQCTHSIVKLRAYMDDTYFAEDWHIDKSFEEEYLSSKSESTATVQCTGDLIFLVSLLGNPTVYRTMGSNSRAEFMRTADSYSEAVGNGFGTGHTYTAGGAHPAHWHEDTLHTAHGPHTDWLKRDCQDCAQNLLHLRGSVHLAGRGRGALHTSPAGGHRILLQVTPVSEESLHKAINKHSVCRPDEIY